MKRFIALPVLVVLAALSVVSVATAHSFETEITCTHVSYFFGAFQAGSTNVIHEQVSIDGQVVVTQDFTFVGTEGTNTVPISVPAGTHTVTVSGSWTVDGGGSQSVSQVVSGCQPVTPPPPPPPPPPSQKTDVAIQKNATAQVTLGSDGKATITYDVRVTNNGPDVAASVTVADPAPSGVTFATVTQQPSQGSCSIGSGGAIVNCSLGTMAVGQVLTFQMTGTVTQTGTVTNCATVTTTTPETNSANNQACAPTTVVPPQTPPVTPTPTPKPPPEVCNTLLAAPKMLKANGKTQRISVKVLQGKKGVKGAKVTVTGPGIRRTVVSGPGGIAIVTFKPGKPGLVRVVISNTKACNTQRIGIVGAYEPPVTG